MAENLYELLNRCTVRIADQASQEQGTGFFVAAGLVLTCAHVVKSVRDDGTVQVFWQVQQDQPVQALRARVVKYVEAHDLALLALDISLDHPFACLSEDVAAFQVLYTFGYPAQLTVDGVSATVECEGWTEGVNGSLLQFKAGQVALGMSGSPLLNVQTGMVCGLISRIRFDLSPLVGYAIPARTILSDFAELQANQDAWQQQKVLWFLAQQELLQQRSGSSEAQATTPLLSPQALAEMYDAVQRRRITDIDTIRRIAAQFEAVANNPTLSEQVPFDAAAGAQNLLNHLYQLEQHSAGSDENAPSSDPQISSEQVLPASQTNSPLTIGQRVRAARIAASMTQQQLARNTYSKSYISAVERGVMVPSVQALGVLAERLGQSMSYFLGDSELISPSLSESRPLPPSGLEPENQMGEVAASFILRQAEDLLRQNQLDKALALLNASGEPPDELRLAERLRWSWLAGLILIRKQLFHDAMTILEKGLNLVASQLPQMPRNQEQQLAEMIERLRTLLGDCYYELHQSETALKQHLQCLSAINNGIVRDPELKCSIFTSLGYDCLMLGFYKEAIGHFQHASRIITDLNNPEQQGLVYWGLGSTFEALSEFQSAKSSIQSALAIFAALNDPTKVSQLLAIFGRILLKLQEYDEAEKSLRQSLGVAERSGDSRTRGLALASFSNLHLANNDPQRAIKTAHDGLKVVQDTGDLRTEGQLYLDLASAYEASKDLSSTEQAYKNAIRIFEQTQDRRFIGLAHERYGVFLADQSRFQDAYEHMRFARLVLASKVERTKVFICYSQADRSYLDAIKKQLKTLIRDDALLIWEITRIQSDSNWRTEIEQAIASAKIMILLISANLLSSSFIASEEFLKSLKAAADEGARILPVILSPSIFPNMPLGQFQAVNDPAKPLNSLTTSERESIFRKLSKLVKEALQDNETTPSPSSQSEARHDVYQHISPTINYIERSELLAEVRQQVLAQATPIELSSGFMNNLIALCGRDGIGKTTVARALCDDPAIQEAFPDGILWATLGERPNLLDQQRLWIEALGGKVSKNRHTIASLRRTLAGLLQERACMLILDDVRKPTDAEAFYVPGPKCRSILTTRDSEIAHEIGAAIKEIPVMTAEEAITLLEGWAEDNLSETEQGLKERIVQQVGYLPLAVKLAGVKLRNKPPEEWQHVLETVKLTLSAAEGGHPQNLQELQVSYRVLLTISAEPILLGSKVEVTVFLSQADGQSEAGYLLEVPSEQIAAGELNVLITAPGFQFEEASVASLPLGIAQDGKSVQPISMQAAHFHLVALRPGQTRVTAELYLDSIFKTSLATEVQVSDIHEKTFLNTDILIRPRPVPQPDLIFQVQSIQNEGDLTFTVLYLLKGLRTTLLSDDVHEYRSQDLAIEWIEQVRQLLASTLEETRGASSTDVRSRLASFGHYLFERLLPPDLQRVLQSLILSPGSLSILILADQHASLPWELLYTNQVFLGERFLIARWPRELDEFRPYEFPVGTVSVVPFANIQEPELWAELLDTPEMPPPQLLPQEGFDDLQFAETMRGVHLIRCGLPPESSDLNDAPVKREDSGVQDPINTQIRPAKLSLHRNKPLVTLGYLSRGNSELTILEQSWAPAFIHAGCSAFVGPLWAVYPDIEAAFVSGFYQYLWAGGSLGEAFMMGRKLAQIAAPDSLDWLAYILFGDPMARPYLPVKGEGYAVVEPIGREMDDVLLPGTVSRFRVSLRRAPPVWHEERVIEVTENLHFEDLQVHIVTFDFEVSPPSPIKLMLTPTGDYIGWFTLVAAENGGSTPSTVQLHFVDSMRPVHSLLFALQVGTQVGEQA